MTRLTTTVGNLNKLTARRFTVTQRAHSAIPDSKRHVAAGSGSAYIPCVALDGEHSTRPRHQQ